MATYTFDDFKKKLAENNLYFSDADMKLAERNPDAGMSLINYKLDYNNATTDELRALANKGAESVRSNYGGYSGGVDGSNYYLSEPSPSSFYYPEMDSYQNNWSQQIKDNFDKLNNYGSFEYGASAPVYNDSYASERQDILDQLINPDPFEYNYKNDDVYKAYAKQYAREGQRATQDTLAAASAQSGGLASSYALTAANQAGNYYASQLSDKIPELYENAYNRYLNEYKQKYNALAAVQGESQSEYDKYLNQLNQYNNDRNFAYQQYSDDYNRLMNNLETASALEQLDYTKYLNDREQYNTDRNFAYNQLLDTISNNQYIDERDYNRAIDAAKLGDYSFLNSLGIDTSRQEALDALEDKMNQLQLGGIYADYGDLSYLNGLGVDTSRQQAINALEDEMNKLQLGGMYADLGDLGYLESMGVDTSELKYDRNQLKFQNSLENQLLQQQIENAKASRNDDAYSRQLDLAEIAASQGDFSLLRALGIDTTQAELAWQQSQQASVEAVPSGEAQLVEAIVAMQNEKASAEQIDLLIQAGLIDPSSIYGTSGTGSNKELIPTELRRTILQQAYGDPRNQLLSEENWKALKAAGYDDPLVSDLDTYNDYMIIYGDMNLTNTPFISYDENEMLEKAKNR